MIVKMTAYTKQHLKWSKWGKFTVWLDAVEILLDESLLHVCAYFVLNIMLL